MSNTGRNDPCPCGSGRKFKHCCGQVRMAQAAGQDGQAMSLPAVAALAKEHFNAGRLPTAEALFRQILAAEPDHPDALHSLGVIAYQAGNNDTAAQLIGRAVQLSPSAPKYSNLGLALQAQDKLDEAAAAYRKALALQPDFAAAHNNLGNALSGLGDLEESVAHLRKAIQFKPDLAPAQANLNRVLNLSDRLKALLAVDLDVDSVELGSHGLGRMRVPELPLELPKATNINLSSLITDGMKHHQAGNLPRAEALYQYARQFKPCAPHALHLLGLVAHQTGRAELALELMGRALDMHPAEPLYAANFALVRAACREQEAHSRDIAAEPKIKIISATRMSEDEFWSQSALGISMRGLTVEKRLVAKIAFENRRGLSEVFNEGIHDSEDDEILVFIHDDVWIDDFFFADRLIRGLNTYDVLGVAGNRRRVSGQPGWGSISYADGKFEGESFDNMCGSIAHGSKPFGVISTFGAGVAAQCELMDGVFMAAKKSRLVGAKVQFDPRFDFHFYDIDFCRDARRKGLRLGTWPIFLTHQSEGAFRSSGWERMYRVYLDKWQS